MLARLANLPGALPGACAQGLIWGIMAIGVYLTYRILDVADLTVDGSFGTGGAVCVMCLLSGQNVWEKLAEKTVEAKRQSIDLPFVPRRCGTLRLRLEGAGQITLRGLAKTMAKAQGGIFAAGKEG